MKITEIKVKGDTHDVSGTKEGPGSNFEVVTKK